MALSLGAASMAGPLAGFYGKPRLEPIIEALSLCVLIKGLTVVQEAKLTREMDFKSLALRTNLSIVVGAVVGVSLALLGWGMWALVWQSLARGIVGLLVLWRAAHWHPRLRFNVRHMRELAWFSIKYFPATLFDFLGTQAEPLIMGKFFGDAAVGVYRLVMRLLDLVITLVSRALWYVSFPYFSEAQGDPARLKARVSDCLRFSMLFSLPLLAVLGMESGALVRVLGPKWADAEKAIQILCVYAAIRSLVLFAGPLLVALGRPHVFSAIMGVQCVAMCVGVGSAAYLLRVAGADQQVAGVAWARVGVYVTVFLPFAIWTIVRNAKLGVSDLLASISPGVAAVVAVALTDLLLVAGMHAVNLPPLFGLAMRGGLAGLAGLAVIAVLEPGIRRSVALVRPSRFRPSSAGSGPGAP